MKNIGGYNEPVPVCFPLRESRVMLIFALLSCCLHDANGSGPLHGTGWAQKSYTVAIHTPWNLDKSERYEYDPATKEHRFWIYKDDASFNETSTTSPRSEIRIKKEYTSGNHQFEADYYFVEGSDRTSIMQVWLGFQMSLRKENGGSLYCWKYPDEIANNVYGRWIHMNVVHMMDEGDVSKGGKVYVYLDGKLASVVDANITSDVVYFKCGVYTTKSEKSEVRIRNIKIYEQVKSSSTEDDLPVSDDIIRLKEGKLSIDSVADTIVDLYDLQGRKLLSTSEKELYLPQAGVYIVKVSGDNIALTRKIVN